MKKQIELKWLILSCLAVWAGCCYFVHGPAILYYLGIHLSTSGLFSYIMFRNMT